MSGEKNKPGADAPLINREYLNENHAELVASIKSEGSEEGIKTGAENERQRVKGVMSQSMAGHESLIHEMAFDGKSTGGDAAMAVLSAEKSKLKAVNDDLSDQAPDPVKTTLSEMGEEDDDKVVTKSSKVMAAEAQVLVANAKKEGRTLSVPDAMKQVIEQG